MSPGFSILPSWLSWSRCQVTPDEAQASPTLPPSPTGAEPISVQSAYACLRYDGYYYTDTVVNLRTGIIQEHQPIPPATPIEPVDQRLVSPDGRVVLFRRGRWLYIQKEGNAPKPVRRVGDVGPELGQRAWWSPDSTQVAYWEEGDLRFINVDGNAQRVKRSSVDRPGDVLGWSPDGRYLTLLPKSYSALHPQFGILDVQTLRFVAVRPASAVDYAYTSTKWSPNGQWLAYVWEDTSDIFHFSLFAPSTGTAFDFPIGKIVYSGDIRWLPDNSYVTFSYTPPNDQIHTDLFNTNGLAIRDDQMIEFRHFWKLLASAWNTSPFIQSIKTGIAAFFASFPETRRFPSHNGQWGALYTRYQGKKSIPIEKSDGGLSIPFVTDADDAGDPFWSPDDSTIGVVWATKQQQTSVARLSWAFAPDFVRHDVGDGFSSIRTVQWMNDYQTLT